MQDLRLRQTVQRKLLMKECGLNGQSHLQEKIAGKKRSLLLRKRCDEWFVIMSGRNHGGSSSWRAILLAEIQFSMELGLMHTSRHTCASAWPKVLRWLGCHFCNQKEWFQIGNLGMINWFLTYRSQGLVLHQAMT